MFIHENFWFLDKSMKYLIHIRFNPSIERLMLLSDIFPEAGTSQLDQFLHPLHVSVTGGKGLRWIITKTHEISSRENCVKYVVLCNCVTILAICVAYCFVCTLDVCKAWKKLLQSHNILLWTLATDGSARGKRLGQGHLDFSCGRWKHYSLSSLSTKLLL